MAKLAPYAIAALFGLSAAHRLPAEQPDTVNLQGYGTATVDGVRSPGEWSAAGAAAFLANLPGGGTTAATLYVMNNGTNFYLGLALASWNLPAQSSMGLIFDNNDNGVCDQGEDALALASSNSNFLNDNFLNAGCLTGDDDVGQGGTSDGSAQVAPSGAASFWEMAHPLNDADNLYDFSLSVGSVVGFSLEVILCGAGCVSTVYPASAWGFFGDMTIVPASWILVDGFESADFSAWSFHTT